MTTYSELLAGQGTNRDGLTFEEWECAAGWKDIDHTNRSAVGDPFPIFRCMEERTPWIWGEDPTDHRVHLETTGRRLY